MVARSGFTVALPSFFRIPGKAYSWVYATQRFLRMCVSREFRVFPANGSSPIVNWIRELCSDLYAEVGGERGIGAIGRCITGNFALSLTIGSQGTVHAPIVSEPSLPFPLPFTGNSAAMHLSRTEEIAVQESDVPVVGLRFTNDFRCTAKRFKGFRRLLGPHRFMSDEIESTSPASGIPADAHSILTNELKPENPEQPTTLALDRAIRFLRSRLYPYP